ncbi:MAG: hypothetical protein B6245_07420 [Desulfobacteraceae bacterium 4572_88]|nr:MAG: hypothetical protein B6245_07420 [Desulfobacteraceae bacterium 4572_88]
MGDSLPWHSNGYVSTMISAEYDISQWSLSVSKRWVTLGSIHPAWLSVIMKRCGRGCKPRPAGKHEIPVNPVRQKSCQSLNP